MTKIYLGKTKYAGLTELVCNGRQIAVDPRITKIKKTGNGKWEGIACGESFEIIGGRESGGAENEWFSKWVHNGDCFLPCKSAAEALRAIEFA